MPFDYSCFISYPHGQDDVLVPFVRDFVEGLEKEVYSQTRKRIWIDFKILKGGYRFTQEIGPDLCKSVCMILFYTPLYFDADHTYCARELKAMQDLELERLQVMTQKSKGLIIPIILRGEKSFPQALREERLCYKFTDIEFNNPEEKLRVKYAKEIKEMAEYIVDLCENLDAIAGAISHNCNDYCLPDSDAARKFIEELLCKKVSEVVVPFVGRTEEIVA